MSQRKYYLKNREKILDYIHNYYITHKEQIILHKKIYRQRLRLKIHKKKLKKIETKIMIPNFTIYFD